MHDSAHALSHAADLTVREVLPAGGRNSHTAPRDVTGGGENGLLASATRVGAHEMNRGAPRLLEQSIDGVPVVLSGAAEPLWARLRRGRRCEARAGEGRARLSLP